MSNGVDFKKMAVDLRQQLTGMTADRDAERLRADTAVAEVAALREELAQVKKVSIVEIIALNGVIDRSREEVREETYKAELYDEVWPKATGMGFMNITMALADIPRLQQRLADAERRNDARDAEIAAQIESALRRSFNLGQVYWQQADSDSTRQQNKCDQTMETQAQHILNVLKSVGAALNLNPKPEAASHD